MPMSDDASGAVVGMSSQVAQKGIDTVMKAGDKIVDAIAKLLQALGAKDKLNSSYTDTDKVKKQRYDRYRRRKG